MTSSLATPIVLSVLRHSLTLIGGAALATKHDSDLVTLAGFLVAIAPFVWGAITAKRNHDQNLDLQEDNQDLAGRAERALRAANEAKTETQMLKKIVSLTE